MNENNENDNARSNKVIHSLKVDPNKLIRHKNIDYNFKQIVEYYLNLSTQKRNHKLYKKIIKKVQRKYLRQNLAVRRKELEIKYSRVESRNSDLNVTDYDQSNKETHDESENLKKIKEHQLWIERERFAQIEWRAKIEKKERDEARKLKQIDEKSQESSRKNHLVEKQAAVRNFEVDDRIDDCIQLANPIETCKYFIKTGVCKYGSLCNRAHVIVSNQNNSSETQSMSTLIIPGMYKNMLLGHEILNLDDECDESLEYEEADIYDHFKQFYDDVYNEFKIYGKVLQLLVCSNYEPHLRGNVYIQYEHEHEARKAFSNLNGRFYGGKQIFCYFTHIKNWYEAVCGEFSRGKCTNGKKCKYLHVFKNPYGEFKVTKAKIFPSDHSVTKPTTLNTYKPDFDNKWTSSDESDDHSENGKNKSLREEKQNEIWEKETSSKSCILKDSSKSSTNQSEHKRNRKHKKSRKSRRRKYSNENRSIDKISEQYMSCSDNKINDSARKRRKYS